jgi:hypothetical protein
MRKIRLNRMSPLLVLVALMFAGCATRKIDWAGRVGSYTFDQVVTDFGPPDKQARLADGSIVAEWLTSRGHSHLIAGPGYYPYGYGPFFPTHLETAAPEYFLRLTFNAEGTLKAWKKYMR